jgi:K+/H+ antiporter YhaU regulatory subunit KhtT
LVFISLTKKNAKRNPRIRQLGITLRVNLNKTINTDINSAYHMKEQFKKFLNEEQDPKAIEKSLQN